jgi:hypothetical protein
MIVPAMIVPAMIVPAMIVPAISTIALAEVSSDQQPGRCFLNVLLFLDGRRQSYALFHAIQASRFARSKDLRKEGS